MNMDFATEIGQNLLLEVRRLQALLSERDRALEKVAEDKENWEGERNNLVASVRAAEGDIGMSHILRLRIQIVIKRRIGILK
jgi:hypothetical protein